MGEGIKGTVPCELFGGPLDGAKYGDLPDIGGPYTGGTLTLPLGDHRDPLTPTAVYVCHGETPVDGLWQFFYERTEFPAALGELNVPSPHPPLPKPLPEAPIGTSMSMGAHAPDSATLQIALARAIATAAHTGQTDKAGAPYVTHVARVASKFDPSDTPVLHAAAWLHDVVEDSALTLNDLRGIGIHPAVLTIVDLLTRLPGVDASEYYRRIAAHHGARAVKRADIDDNTDPARMARLHPSVRARLTTKYERARLALANGGK